MNELEVTWARTMQVWWAVFWRSIVFVTVPAVLLAAVTGIVLAVNKMPLEPHAWKMQAAGGAIGLFAGIWVTKVILSKSYSGFRIVLVAVSEGESMAQQAAQADGPASGGPAA